MIRDQTRINGVVYVVLFTGHGLLSGRMRRGVKFVGGKEHEH